MKTNATTKSVTPENWLEVFDIWAAPSSLDYDSGGEMCRIYAAIEYAGVSFDEAKDWDIRFEHAGYAYLFKELARAYKSNLRHFKIDTGEEVGFEEQCRAKDDPILKVALAVSKNPDEFEISFDEAENGIPFIRFKRNGNIFEFTILEDPEMFWSFYYWILKENKRTKAEEKKKSADAFLASL